VSRKALARRRGVTRSDAWPETCGSHRRASRAGFVPKAESRVLARPGWNPGATKCQGVCADVLRCPGWLSRSLSPTRPASLRTLLQLTACLQNPPKASHTVRGLVHPVQPVPRDSPASGFVGVRCGCHSLGLRAITAHHAPGTTPPPTYSLRGQSVSGRISAHPHLA
jgi:hypothetical protein